jgi:hypothetical protein
MIPFLGFIRALHTTFTLLLKGGLQDFSLGFAIPTVSFTLLKQ